MKHVKLSDNQQLSLFHSIQRKSSSMALAVGAADRAIIDRHGNGTGFCPHSTPQSPSFLKLPSSKIHHRQTVTQQPRSNLPQQHPPSTPSVHRNRKSSLVADFFTDFAESTSCDPHTFCQQKFQWQAGYNQSTPPPPQQQQHQDTEQSKDFLCFSAQVSPVFATNTLEDIADNGGDNDSGDNDVNMGEIPLDDSVICPKNISTPVFSSSQQRLYMRLPLASPIIIRPFQQRKRASNKLLRTKRFKSAKIKSRKLHLRRRGFRPVDISINTDLVIADILNQITGSCHSSKVTAKTFPANFRERS